MAMEMPPTDLLFCRGVLASRRSTFQALSTNFTFHQVVAWSAPSTFDRAVFERLLDGFAEIPGSDAAQRSARFAQPRSGYDVH
jgi:hypothetical protein